MKQTRFDAFPTPEIGSSSLVGYHYCNYCEEPCAQEGRFYILVPNKQQNGFDKKGSFCTPECAAGYNSYLSSVTSSEDHIRARHLLIEREFGRTVRAAPPPKYLKRYNKKDGYYRRDWLQNCRHNLSQSAIEAVKKEMIVNEETPVDRRRCQ